ncbi:beta-mannanase [Cytobacillus praedii]|uniref:beta-mannanase n=1 Tax=Cytobacillus praedii TaxID=1742358 RepID=UPI003AF768AB
MNWSYAESNQWIKEPKIRMQDYAVILSWQWPKNIEFVYICKAAEEDGLSFGEESSIPMKLYTREEYKSNAGYKDTVDSIGKIVYKIYPAIHENGKIVILNQDNQHNEITIKAQKAKIYYSIKYKKGWFSSKKTVKITIKSEVFIPKETLCYVKKKESHPTSTIDGSIYHFVNDFQPGRTFLPEIQINKDDYIRLFFTNGKQYGDLYELIPE